MYAYSHLKVHRAHLTLSTPTPEYQNAPLSDVVFHIKLYGTHFWFDFPHLVL